MPSLSYRKVVDLSHTLYHEMPVWPTQPTIRYEYMAYAARDLYTITLITRMTTHTGTHLDVPFHFLPEGKTVDQIPIEAFLGEGVVLDLSYKRSGEEITEDDLKQYDSEIREGDVVMLHTGWDKKRGLNKEYLFLWPYVGISGAKYLVSKKIKAVGTDGLSIGGWMGEVPAQKSVTDTLIEVHRILLGAEIIVIEELANLDKVLEGKKTARAFFVYTPLKLVGGDASPCRAIAFV